jgi:hypothetical protein
MSSSSTQDFSKNWCGPVGGMHAMTDEVQNKEEIQGRRLEKYLSLLHVIYNSISQCNQSSTQLETPVHIVPNHEPLQTKWVSNSSRAKPLLYHPPASKAPRHHHGNRKNSRARLVGLSNIRLEDRKSRRVVAAAEGGIALTRSPCGVGVGRWYAICVQYADDVEGGHLRSDAAFAVETVLPPSHAACVFGAELGSPGAGLCCSYSRELQCGHDSVVEYRG